MHIFNTSLTIYIYIYIYLHGGTTASFKAGKTITASQASTACYKPETNYHSSRYSTDCSCSKQTHRLVKFSFSLQHFMLGCPHNLKLQHQEHCVHNYPTKQACFYTQH